MISNELGQNLHDKATRGIVLASSEQQQLEQWYTEQDQAEAELLQAIKLPKPVLGLSDLQTQIDTTLVQIGAMAKRLQTMMFENQSLRQEIADLRQQ